MRFISLFSGIEAATVAWHPLGWECAAVAEIEPFPCKVLKHHYPDVPNLGDVTKITEQDIQALGHIDVIVFGSPCQDLSVAGKRRGLVNADGTVTRSGLFFTAINIARWSGARFWIWENVPGAFSSNEGRDFASVVEFMAGLDDVAVPPKGWGTEGVAFGDNGLLEWGTLDAQWFGVAQRRRRVFAVLDTGDWAGRPPILLEPEGVRGDSPPSRETRQATAGTTGESIEVSCKSITARMVAFGEYQDDGTASTMKSRDYKDATDLVAQPINFGAKMSVPQVDIDICQTLGAKNPQAVACMRESGQGYWMEDDKAGTLRAEGENRPSRPSNVIQQSMQVRRLTHVECLRLQGFPDDYLETHYADADEANAAQILHALWREAGTPTVEKQGWRTGISAALLTPEILLSGVYGGWLSWALSARCAAARGAIQGENFDSEGFVRELRRNAELGRSPYQRESFGQLARELGRSLSELPLESAQARAALRCSGLWQEAQRSWPLRYALATRSQAEKGRMNPDGPRYKALGNSMAVPVMRWIGKQIDAAVSVEKSTRQKGNDNG